MAVFDSDQSKFSITDTGSSSRDLSAFINQIGGLPGTRGMNDKSGLTNSSRAWHPSLREASITLGMTWDNTATSGPDVVLAGLLDYTTAATAWEYGPEGTTSGDFKYSGNQWTETYEITSQVGNLVIATATLKVDGAITRGTY